MTELEKTALDRGRTDCISLTHDLDLDLRPTTFTSNPLQATIMMYSLAKVQGQRSVGSEDRVETIQRTEAIALPAALMRLVTMLPCLLHHTLDKCTSKLTTIVCLCGNAEASGERYTSSHESVHRCR